MSKVTNQLNNIIRNAGWAKSFADFSDVVKFKKITGIEWVNENMLSDADNEPKLLWMIAGGNCFPKIGGDEPVRPDVTPNTPAQDKIQEDIISKIKSGTNNITIDGLANNITIPTEARKTVTLTGKFQDGFTLTNVSDVNVTIVNTGDAASAIIESTSPHNDLTLTGKFVDVYATVRRVFADNANISSIIFDNTVEGTGDLYVKANWNSDVRVVTYNTNNISIDNASDDTILEKLEIVAPNATISLYGKWGDVTVTSGEDTLKLYYNSSIDKLTVVCGNVLVYSADPSNTIKEIIIPEKYTCKPFEYHAPSEGVNLAQNAGIYYIDSNITTSIDLNKYRYGIYKYINNATVASSADANLYLKSDADVTVEGGEWTNSNGYGVWLSNKDGKVKINSGKFTSDTSAVYAENGTIEIYGGEFSVNDGQDAKYLLNCYDSSYKSGTASIKVYGGKFHGFDPANSLSEGTTPVSFVVDGYKSVQTAENVWEVVAADVEIDEYVSEDAITNTITDTVEEK